MEVTLTCIAPTHTSPSRKRKAGVSFNCGYFEMLLFVVNVFRCIALACGVELEMTR